MGIAARRMSMIASFGLALGLFCGSFLGFFASLGMCRRENVTPPAACPLVNDGPGMFFWVAVVAPALAIVAFALVGVGRRALAVSGAATLVFWVGYFLSVLVT